MSSMSNKQKTDLIKKVITATKGISKRKPSVREENFIRQFYANVRGQDLIEKPVDALAGTANSAWNFIQSRKSGETKIRVLNPSLKADGWDGSHSFVQIVMEDMPFLVDSVSAHLSRRGITVHQVVHPILGIERKSSGLLKKIHDKSQDEKQAIPESVMSFEVSQIAPVARQKEIQAEVKSVLKDVRAAVEDWQPVRSRVQKILCFSKRANIFGGDP